MVHKDITAGELAVKMMEELESQGIPALYLRHYQNLPRDVGNDADILVKESRRSAATELVIKVAYANNWWLFSIVPFSSDSLFFVRDDATELLHVDLFVREEWHWLEYADMVRMLSRRRFNGLVHHPDIGDEIYLNVINRLIYQGLVRDKHRAQVAQHLAAMPASGIRQAFIDHLGARRGELLVNAVLEMKWEAVEAMRGQVMLAAMWRYGIGRIGRSTSGLWRYASRVLARLRHPPGLFLVFEGADGVGKSTVIEGVLPLLEKLTGRGDSLMFHWKPLRGNFRQAGAVAPAARSPRGKAARGQLASLLFLTYHWLGYWVGWWRRLRPHLLRNGAVVADRYAYDLWLDPERFRLNVPDWVLRLAMRTAPQPDAVICLVADASLVRERKPELSIQEINIYQNRLRQMAADDPRMLLISANGDPTAVYDDVCASLLRGLRAKRQRAFS